MENLTVVELKQRCKSLNIKLTKTDGSSKLKKDLIKSLSKVNNKSIVGGGRKRGSRKSRTNSRKKLSKRKTTRNQGEGVN